MKYIYIAAVMIAAILFGNKLFIIYNDYNTELKSTAYAQALQSSLPLSHQQVIDQVNATNFGLHMGATEDTKALCSATLVDKERHYLITAWHCLAAHDKNGNIIKPVKIINGGEAAQIYLTDDGETTGKSLYTFKTIITNQEMDVAIIQLIKSNDGHWPEGPAAQFACTNPHRLDNIYLVGNPYGLFGFIVKGSVVKVQMNDDGHIVFYSGTTGPGMSGGAVLNQRGRIVAIINEQVADNKTIGIGSGLQNILNFISHINVTIPDFTASFTCSD